MKLTTAEKRRTSNLIGAGLFGLFLAATLLVGLVPGPKDWSEYRGQLAGFICGVLGVGLACGTWSYLRAVVRDGGDPQVTDQGAAARKGGGSDG